MTLIERVRERVQYMPTRTQARLVAGLTVVFIVICLVLEHVLSGLAHEAFWAVMFVLLGVSLTLHWQSRRRR